jgi:hypothetical protein
LAVRAHERAQSRAFALVGNTVLKTVLECLKPTAQKSIECGRVSFA